MGAGLPQQSAAKYLANLQRLLDSMGIVSCPTPPPPILHPWAYSWVYLVNAGTSSPVTSPPMSVGAPTTRRTAATCAAMTTARTI